MNSLDSLLCQPWEEFEQLEKRYHEIKNNVLLTKEQKDKEYKNLLIDNKGTLSDLC